MQILPPPAPTPNFRIFAAVLNGLLIPFLHSPYPWEKFKVSLPLVLAKFRKFPDSPAPSSHKPVSKATQRQKISGL